MAENHNRCCIEENQCIELNYKEIAGILNQTIIRIEDAIIRTLEECPPELSGDIYVVVEFILPEELPYYMD